MMEAINAGGQHCLYCGWDLDRRERLRQAIGAWHTNQHPGLDQGPHALL
jgi:hypothetical protein